MHPDFMKHKASLWQGEYGCSVHITDVHWEGNISQEELVKVADQISVDWETINLELDPSHPAHGQVFRLRRTWPNSSGEASDSQVAEAERELVGKYVWVHCCKHVYDPEGEIEDELGSPYRQNFQTVMFCTEFTTFDDIASMCDDNFGPNEWSEYELYLDDLLPEPVAYYR